MNNQGIKLSEGRTPKAIVPQDIAHPVKEHYAGVIVGYYVKNTRVYNIMPNDATIDQEKVKILGNIYDIDIIQHLTPQAKEQISFLETDIDMSLTPAERLLALKNKKKAVTEVPNVNYCVNELNNIIHTCDNSINHDADDFLLVGYWSCNKLHLIEIATLTEVKIETYALKLDIFSRNTGILESDIMLDKGALFIGCGSVGSLMAVELAKAGVGRFMLIDSDTFNYHNICRHQCGIYDVGKYKTDAVAEKILQINPYAQVIKRNMTIQEVDIDDIKAFCNKNAIIIGGADNREGDLYANQFAVSQDCAFISIGCWERAFAGEIFYSVPSAGMPTYDDFIKAIGGLSERITQNRRYYTTEEELEKTNFEPGISADINYVTIIAVKMALDLLNRDNQNYTQRLIPYLTEYTLVCNTNNSKIGGENAEIFSYPLQVTTSIKVPFANK